MAKSKNTYPLRYVTENLDKIVSGMITEYSQELEAKADQVTEKVAKDFAEKLKPVTPRSNVIAGAEHLADTIVVKAKKERKYGKITTAQYVHYKKWQIAHLLEFGWTLRNGKRLERQPFIRPLFDQNKERYYNMYKEELNNK